MMMMMMMMMVVMMVTHTRSSRFGINTAVVPAPIENFFLFQRSFIH